MASVGPIPSVGSLGVSGLGNLGNLGNPGGLGLGSGQLSDPTGLLTGALSAASAGVGGAATGGAALAGGAVAGAGLIGNAVGPAQGFVDTLGSAFGQLNQQLVGADGAMANFAAGGSGDLHTVMLQMQEASLGLQVGIQVRDRLLEAYQEVMRLQL